LAKRTLLILREARIGNFYIISHQKDAILKKRHKIENFYKTLTVNFFIKCYFFKFRKEKSRTFKTKIRDDLCLRCTNSKK